MGSFGASNRTKSESTFTDHSESIVKWCHRGGDLDIIRDEQGLCNRCCGYSRWVDDCEGKRGGGGGGIPLLINNLQGGTA